MTFGGERMMKLKMADPRRNRVADLKPGQYNDGSPLDDIQYLECKLILKTDEFTSAKGFKKYSKLVAQAAKECGVGFDPSSARGARPAIREVMFLERCAKFFIRLQEIGAAWIYLGATKTGMVYRLKGNPPQAHE